MFSVGQSAARLYIRHKATEISKITMDANFVGLREKDNFINSICWEDS